MPRDTHGHLVTFPRLNVVRPGLVPLSGLLEQPGQAEVGLGEAGSEPDQSAVGGPGPGGIRGLELAGALEFPRERLADLARGRGGQDRAVRLEVTVIGGRDGEDGKRADGLAVRGDRLEPVVEVGHDAGAAPAASRPADRRAAA